MTEGKYPCLIFVFTGNLIPQGAHKLPEHEGQSATRGTKLPHVFVMMESDQKERLWSEEIKLALAKMNPQSQTG